MEELFRLITSNPLIFIIIAVFVARLLRPRKNQTNEQKSKQQQAKPTLRSLLEEAFNEENVEKTKQVIENRQHNSQKMQQTSVSEIKQKAVEEVDSFEQAHEKQLERFRSKFKPTYDVDDVHNTNSEYVGKNSRLINVNKSDTLHSQPSLNLQITQQKLMESVIMAEVLGPPRSLNRYENIALKRRR